MKWLADWYLREGPGIPKRLPEKRGLALFVQIVGREAIELFKLNLVLILASLPVVTVFAAHAAGLRIAGTMVRDETVYLREDFIRAFRELFVAATLAGLTLSAVLGLSAYAVFVYGQLAAQDLAFAAPLTVAAAVLALGLIFSVNVFAALAGGSGGRAAARLAFLATLGAPLPVTGALAFVGALWLAHILFYPVSVFMPVAFNFSLGLLAFAFAARASAARITDPGAGCDRADGPERNGVGDAIMEEQTCAR